VQPNAIQHYRGTGIVQALVRSDALRCKAHEKSDSKSTNAHRQAETFRPEGRAGTAEELFKNPVSLLYHSSLYGFMITIC
jgi:hypothetical protein